MYNETHAYQMHVHVHVCIHCSRRGLINECTRDTCTCMYVHTSIVPHEVKVTTRGVYVCTYKHTIYCSKTGLINEFIRGIHV